MNTNIIASFGTLVQVSGPCSTFTYMLLEPLILGKNCELYRDNKKSISYKVTELVNAIRTDSKRSGFRQKLGQKDFTTIVRIKKDLSATEANLKLAEINQYFYNNRGNNAVFIPADAKIDNMDGRGSATLLTNIFVKSCIVRDLSDSMVSIIVDQPFDYEYKTQTRFRQGIFRSTGASIVTFKKDTPGYDTLIDFVNRKTA